MDSVCGLVGMGSPLTRIQGLIPSKSVSSVWDTDAQWCWCGIQIYQLGSGHFELGLCDLIVNDFRFRFLASNDHENKIFKVKWLLCD